MKSGVYEIRNISDGKRYIGSSARLNNRRVRHMGRLKRGTHINPYLQSAWDKHGPTAFEFRTLLFCSVENLLMYEQRAIDAFRPEYNIARYAGAPMRGRKASAETIAKRVRAREGKTYIISDAQRARISETHKGKTLSAETRRKMSAALKGRKGNRDFRHRPESIAKMVASAIGRKLTPEHRAKIAAAGVGRTHSIESRNKISQALKGKALSSEYRRKLVEAWKRRAPISAESRAKITAAITGKPKSAEHNAKVSAALKGRTFSPEHRKHISEARKRYSSQQGLVRDVA